MDFCNACFHQLLGANDSGYFEVFLDISATVLSAWGVQILFGASPNIKLSNSGSHFEFSNNVLNNKIWVFENNAYFASSLILLPTFHYQRLQILRCLFVHLFFFTNYNGKQEIRSSNNTNKITLQTR